MEDAELVVVAFGIAARIARGAIKTVRREGLKVGLLRPVTLWPFPSEKIQEMARTQKQYFVFEMNMGQMLEDVQLALSGKGEVSFYGRPGGVIPTPNEVARIISRIYYQKGLKSLKKIYSRPKSLKKAHFHYCPGCGHSVAHRLICEVIDEMDLQDKTIGVPPPGCSVFAYNYIDVDMAESAHGRGAAVATGIKRAHPEVHRLYLSGGRRPRRDRHGRDDPCRQPGGEHHHNLHQ